jgi:L-2,4-diaminobutyrate decarboxylase
MHTPPTQDLKRFEELGRTILAMIREHLTKVQDEPETLKVLPHISPHAMLERWPAEFREPVDAEQLLAKVVEWSHHLHHPHYVGHQVTAPIPESALFAMVSAFLNNGSAVYEMGPVAIAMERQALRWMAARVGYSPGADGILTSGGSVGNLTALLAARQAKAGFDVWRHGLGAGPPLALLVSDQAHYCVKRAAQIMGLGEYGVIVVPSDDRYRLRVESLPAALKAARARGRHVFAVVGSACSTPTGAIDPLDAIADFAEREGLWFHVDGAHGASFVLAPSRKVQLKGIERADSLVWDAHKMLLMPALLTAVLFKDARHSYEAFAQHASYLFLGDERPEDNWYDVGRRTLECTKLMLGFSLYACLATKGEAFFTNYLEGRLQLAEAFARRLEQHPRFELAVFPDANILCFRLRTNDPAKTQALQSKLRQALVAQENFYLVQTDLRGETYLRTTLISPQTRLEHLERLMDELLRLADSLEL